VLASSERALKSCLLQGFDEFFALDRSERRHDYASAGRSWIPATTGSL
jgi:hypothetical protein